MPLTTSSPPEQGQLVQVRGRRWIVSAVQRSALTPSPLDGPAQPPQHLVTLTSVEDDGMGEEISVIWEIEPAVETIERYGLPEPTGFDDPRRLDAFLHAVRWGATSTADVRALQAPFRSGIEIEDYQLDPVVRAVQMPRANLLVADDVGLGKTIEAGLVVQEFITRHRARTVLVVCPSSLQIQWRDQMRDKFGLEFRIVDSALMKDLRRRRGIHVNPWSHFPRLITSIDFIKRERPLRLMREVLPAPGEPTYPRRFDIMIVDEAHNVAPSGRGRYATDSLRTLAIRTLAPHFEHKLFLSATPHNGYSESFRALLELLDNQRFHRGADPDRKQLAAVMVRRLKSELPPRWDGTPRSAKRVPKLIKVPYGEEERQIHAALQRYTESRRKRAESRTEVFATEFVLKLLKKRLFSCPVAFGRTLAVHEESLKTARRRTGPNKKAPSYRFLQQQADKLDEGYDDDTQYEEYEHDAVETTTRLFTEPSQEEKQFLKQMREWASTHSGRPDCKAEQLLKWLRKTIKPGGKWSNDRVIIFTEYRDTLNWLQQILSAKGFSSGGRLMTLYGGMDSDKREEIKAAFQTSPEKSPVRILLATDAASEGIDLQNHCSRLIHFEIPWNPNRMEQRNGRIDRYGQRAKEVEVFHFVDSGFREDAPRGDGKPGDLRGDLEFLYRAVLKLQQMENDLFGKVAPVVAHQVEEAMLGKRTVLDTSQAERDAEPQRRLLKLERDLKAQIRKLHERLTETRSELELSPENVRHVVEVALALAGQPSLQEAELEGVWPSDSGHWKHCPVFHLPPLRGSWARCTEGLQHPHTQEIRPITFDYGVATDQPNADVVLVHLNHRLVQMSLRLLRAEVWSPTTQRKLNRVTARVSNDAGLKTPAVIAHARLVIIGGDGQRLHEEIISGGGTLTEGRFKRLNVTDCKRILASGTDASVTESLKERFVELWEGHRDSLATAIERRAEERFKGLQKALSDRCAKEAKDAQSILEELDRSLAESVATFESEIERERWELYERFTAEERDQFQRNTESIKKRREQIPAEILRERQAIEARFADLQHQLFPVAVSYLVPARLAQKG